MANVWKLNSVKTASSTLGKYHLALSIAEKPLLESGYHIYDNVNTLIDLRNELVHYKPETIIGTGRDKKAEVAYKLEKRLANKKFALNALLPSNNFFPDRCLSHGCAKWSVLTSLDFTDEFFLRIGLSPPYEHIRSRLIVD